MVPVGRDVASYSVLNMLTVDLFQTFPKDFIDRNPQIFLNFEWINVSKLKKFIESELNMLFYLR